MEDTTDITRACEATQVRNPLREPITAMLMPKRSQSSPGNEMHGTATRAEKLRG